MLYVAAISRPNFSRFSLVGLNTCSFLMVRTRVNACMWVRAIPPEPSIPTTSASSFAMYLTPMPPSAPTRMCCKWPSLMKASGSPFSIEVSRIRPQNSPGRVQYFSCVTTPLYSLS